MDEKQMESEWMVDKVFAGRSPARRTALLVPTWLPSVLRLRCSASGRRPLALLSCSSWCCGRQCVVAVLSGGVRREDLRRLAMCVDSND
eukprot:1557874-Rhodomonas_salina.4